jgi:signal peptidase I
VREDNLVEYRNPGMALPVADALTEVLRRGAGALLQEAVEAEVAEVIARYQALKDERGHQRVVRNGHQPERSIQTGIGAVPVKAPRVAEPYVASQFNQSQRSRQPVFVRPHYYYVLGDNRDNSSDSRLWGFVPERYVYAKVVSP